MHVPIDELERLAHVHALISAMRMRSEQNCLTCKHKFRSGAREHIPDLVRLKDAEKVVYIMLRDNRGVHTVQLKLRYVTLACW